MTREEFQEMASAIRPRLLAHATRLLTDGEAAEDAVQDTLLKLWTMRERLDDYSSQESLAAVICRNICLDRLRSPAMSRRESLDISEAREIAGSGPSPMRRLTDREALDEALRLIDSLPDAVQSVMRMRHVDGLETEEIAEIIGAKVEAVRVNLSRGRKRLKELFDSRYV